MSNNLNLTTCSQCSKPTLLTTCISCLRGQINKPEKNVELNCEQKKSQCIKSIMEIHKLKVIKNSKKPCAKITSKNKQDKTQKNWYVLEPNVIIDESYLNKSNWGILCNKATGLTGIDLDQYKWSPEHGCHKAKEFYDKFGDDYIKTFNTYTQKTPSGGIHLVFQYDKDLNQVESQLSSKFGKGIDIRNGHENNPASGGYLVGAGSVYRKPDGTFAKYELVLDEKPKPIPSELKEWLLENIYTEVEAIKAKTKKIKKNHSVEIQESQGLYDYFIEDRIIEELICQKLPVAYFNEYILWLRFTSAMKVLGAVKLWDTYSKKYGGDKYDKDNNNKIWNGIKLNNPKFPNSYYVESIIKKVPNKDLIHFIKYKKIPVNTHEPNQIINRQKLSKINNEDTNFISLDLKNNINGFVIKSDTGTGKTTLMKRELFKCKNPFISIVSRVSLGKEQYNDFNENGVECNFYMNHYAQKGDSMITTIDSLPSLHNLFEDIRKYTLFIDEFNSVLEYIFQADQCLGKSREKCWELLIYCIKNCKNFVCVDADISDLCFEFLKEIQRPYKYIKNEYKHNKGIVACEMSNLDHFIKRIKEEVKNTGKCIVACDSKKSAEFIYLETGEKAKLLTSATEKLDNETLDDHDFIIFSPAIIYGLDSTMTRAVFAYHKEHTISPTNMVQQIARCRNITKLTFMFQTKKYKDGGYIDYKHCEEVLREKEMFSFSQFNPLTPKQQEQQDIFNKLLVNYSYKMDCFNTNKYVHFKKLLHDRGFILQNLKYKSSEKPDTEKIDEMVDGWKLGLFDINSEAVQDFNTKYLENLNNLQLQELREIFTDEGICKQFFAFKSYFDKGIKNMPLYNAQNEYNKVKNEDFAKQITAEQLPYYYDSYNQYTKIIDVKDIKTKKVDSQKFKFYILDYLKCICAYKEERKMVKKVIDKEGNTEEVSSVNIIKATKVPTPEEQKQFLRAFKVAFNFRGKTEPKLNTIYNCEKMLNKILKITFNCNYINKPVKIRVGEKTEYQYTLNYDCHSLELARKCINFQRTNRIKTELELNKYKDDFY